MKREAPSAETACETIVFPPFSFYPDKDVHVQVTVNHWNSTRQHFIHDASVFWVENVNFRDFKVSDVQKVAVDTKIYFENRILKYQI